MTDQCYILLVHQPGLGIIPASTSLNKPCFTGTPMNSSMQHSGSTKPSAAMCSSILWNSIFMSGYRESAGAHFFTCNANHSPLRWVQNLSWGGLGAFDSLVLGQVPGQGVSRTGNATSPSIALFGQGSLLVPVLPCRHHLPTRDLKSWVWVNKTW